MSDGVSSPSPRPEQQQSQPEKEVMKEEQVTSGVSTSSTASFDLQSALAPQEGDYYLSSNWVWYYNYVTKEDLEEDERKKQEAKDAAKRKEREEREKAIEAAKKKEEDNNDSSPLEKDDSIKEEEGNEKETIENNNSKSEQEKSTTKDDDPNVSNSTTSSTTTPTSSSNQKKESKWDSNFALTSFSTINGFWSIYKKLLTPSLGPAKHEGRLRYYVFREGIEPKFEAPENVGGGYWQVYPQNMDEWWEQILLSMLGESLEQSVYTEEELTEMARKEVEEGILWADQIDRFILGVESQPDRGRLLIWTKQADRADRVERLSNFLNKLFGGKLLAYYYTFVAASSGDKLTKNNSSYQLKVGKFEKTGK